MPKRAGIVAISQNPLTGHMVYQNMHAGHYPEGDVAITVSLPVQEPDDGERYYGVLIGGPEYERAASTVDGYARQIRKPAELKEASRGGPRRVSRAARPGTDR